MGICTTSGEMVYYAKFANHSVCIDDSINENHGTYNNILFDSGVKNGAACFNNIDSSITVPHDDNLTFTKNAVEVPFSVSFWVNIYDPTTHSPVLSKGLLPTDNEYVITTIGDQPHGSITLFDVDTSNEISCQSQECLCEYDLNNDWLFVCITYDASGDQAGLNMYFNGEPIEVIRTGHPGYIRMRPNGADLHLGIDNIKGYTEYVEGRLDEIIIHDYELSEEQSRILFQSYKFEGYSMILIDKDLISLDKNISIYRNNEFIETVVYGQSFNVTNVDEYSFILHEDNFDRFTHIENIGDTTTSGLSYLIYAFLVVGIIGLLMYMYRRF